MLPAQQDTNCCYAAMPISCQLHCCVIWMADSECRPQCSLQVCLEVIMLPGKNMQFYVTVNVHNYNCCSSYAAGYLAANNDIRT